MEISKISLMIDEAMRNILLPRDMGLYRMMGYHLGWEDQLGQPVSSQPQVLYRGVTCVMACSILGGAVESAMPPAVAVELIECFCQVHDDVQSGNPKRDGRDAVWWTWGPAQAINAGDGLYALARVSLMQLADLGIDPEIVLKGLKVLDSASLEVCEGRFEDLEAQERIDLSVEDWIKMANRKTGALFDCSMKLGSLAATAGDTDAEHMAKFGRSLGVAFQVRSEMRQMWSETNSDQHEPSMEVLNKKKLIPIVYAFEKANLNTKRKLGEIYFKRVLNNDDLPEIYNILEDIGAHEFCESLIDQYCDQALEAVKDVTTDGFSTMRGFIDELLRA